MIIIVILILKLFNRFDTVGGLAIKSVTLPSELRIRQIACIGDREEVIEKRGVILAPVAPNISKTLQLKIVEWHLMIPGRVDYEARVRILVTKQMNLMNSSKSKIIRRTLKLGITMIIIIHNCYYYYYYYYYYFLYIYNFYVLLSTFDFVRSS